jgi:hypothetical protein
MQLVYDSESFAVMVVEIPAGGETGARGAFEIVDKRAHRDIFLEGVLAETFKAGAVTLMASGPSEDDIDDYIGRFTDVGHQPLVLH